MPPYYLPEQRLVKEEEWYYRSSLAARAVSCKASQYTLKILSMLYASSGFFCSAT